MTLDRARSEYIYDKTAAAAAVLYFTVQCFLLNDYGITADEPSSFERGRLALKIICAVFNDGSPYGFTAADLPAKNYIFHPSFFSLLQYAAAEKLALLLQLPLVASAHLISISFFSAALLLQYRIVRNCSSARDGLFALLFMIFTPQLFAQAQSDFKDISLLAGFMASILLLQRAIKFNRLADWAGAGIACGLALSSKLDAILIFLILAPALCSKDQFGRLFQQLSKYLVFGLATVSVFFLLWPVLWIDPLFFLSSLRHFSSNFNNNEIYYLGQIYQFGSVPWHYYPLSLLAYTPLPTLLFFFAGLFSLRKRIFEPSMVLLIAWILVPLAAKSFLPILRYNGIRHLLFILPAIAALAGIGLGTAVDRIKNSRIKIYPAYCALFAVSFIWPAASILSIHPFQTAYVNEVTRLLVGKDLYRYFALEYWGASYKQGLNWLEDRIAPKTQICIGNYYFLKDYYTSDRFVHVCEGSPKYILLLPGLPLAERRFDQLNLDPQMYRPVHTIMRLDSPLLVIYERNSVPAAGN